MQTTMKIEHSVVIKADQARVWQAITDAAQISQWFDGSMGWEFKAAAGESITFRYNGEIIGTGKVVTAEPPERFAFRWTPEPGNPVESLVTFVLDAVAEGTRVTISEAGFEALPDAVRQKRYEMNGMGWGIALDHLAGYLANSSMKGEETNMEATLKITRTITVAAGRERVWKAITVPEEINQWFEKLEFARLVVGEPIHFSWGEEGEIAIVEPMDRFGYRWRLASPDPTMTLVVFTLETIPEGTRLTVTETGFEALAEREKHFKQNSEGWEEEFGDLEAYLGVSTP